MTLTVLCVCRFGGIYDETWVAKLRDGVARHLAEPHRFVCLTDSPSRVAAVGVGALPLRHNWPGWWSKIEAFRVSWGRVLYLDLDSVVVGDLAPLFRDRLTMVADFVGGARGWHNSSVMAWSGDMTGIYEAFRWSPDAAMLDYRRCEDGRHGDQAFIEDHVMVDAFEPGAVVSYKKHARNGPPEGAAVICFHGQPKMPQAGGWVRDAW